MSPVWKLFLFIGNNDPVAVVTAAAVQRMQLYELLVGI